MVQRTKSKAYERAVLMVKKIEQAEKLAQEYEKLKAIKQQARMLSPRRSR